MYRGRLAPSPTGYLHIGHAATFGLAAERCRDAGGLLVFRNEDIDPDRRRPEFVAAMFEDLRGFGLGWDEGPDCGGPYGPYNQSERLSLYREALERLKAGGFLYPCVCSRRDIRAAVSAPHEGEGARAVDDEVRYPGTCRDRAEPAAEGARRAWRFRVPDGEPIRFTDARLGPREYIAGRDFGDFVVWRPDDVPAYQLAVVVDDAAMAITEVVRGADLLLSTARQLLLYRALGLEPPSFCHADLVTDEDGVRLAKRHDALSLRALRASGDDSWRERLRRWRPSGVPGA